MAIYSGFSHGKWWFSIATLNYQRVPPNHPKLDNVRIETYGFGVPPFYEPSKYGTAQFDRPRQRLLGPWKSEGMDQRPPWKMARDNLNFMYTVYVYICTYVHMYICMDIWIYGYMDIWIYGYMDIYIWIYIYMDIYMDIYIYGYMDILIYPSKSGTSFGG
jgi:hypothetical protein